MRKRRRLPNLFRLHDERRPPAAGSVDLFRYFCRLRDPGAEPEPGGAPREASFYPGDEGLSLERRIEEMMFQDPEAG